MKSKPFITPGRHIKKEIKKRGWDTETFAIKIGWTFSMAIAVLYDQIDITDELAGMLAYIFYTPKKYWLELQKEWEEKRQNA